METFLEGKKTLKEWFDSVSEPMEGKNYGKDYKPNRGEWIVKSGSKEALNHAISGKIRQNEEERVASMNAAGNIIVGGSLL